MRDGEGKDILFQPLGLKTLYMKNSLSNGCHRYVTLARAETRVTIANLELKKSGHSPLDFHYHLASVMMRFLECVSISPFIFRSQMI